MTDPRPIEDDPRPPECVHLPWDTEFFGVRVARVDASRLDDTGATAVRRWARTDGTECVYFLNEPADDASVAAAQRAGFREIDVRVELELQLEAGGDDPSNPVENVAPATARDEAPLAEMARELHVDSRFFEDPNFPDERARELYARWIEKSLRSPSDEVLVARHGGAPAGYVACQMEGADTGRIGLIGVAAEAQGVGLGSALVQASIAWFRSRGARRVLVVTQGRNEPALRLYSKAGFRPYSRGIWLHLWALRDPD